MLHRDCKYASLVQEVLVPLVPLDQKETRERAVYREARVEWAPLALWDQSALQDRAALSEPLARKDRMETMVWMVLLDPLDRRERSATEVCIDPFTFHTLTSLYSAV